MINRECGCCTYSSGGLMSSQFRGHIINTRIQGFFFKDSIYLFWYIFIYQSLPMGPCKFTPSRSRYCTESLWNCLFANTFYFFFSEKENIHKVSKQYKNASRTDNDKSSLFGFYGENINNNSHIQTKWQMLQTLHRQGFVAAISNLYFMDGCLSQLARIYWLSMRNLQFNVSIKIHCITSLLWNVISA